jgi:acetyl esterase/lipase
MKLLICAIVCVFSLSACSTASILNATIPSSGYAVHKDIAYDKDPRQKLDIYVPDHAKNAPVIVFFYGGSWRMGSKDDYLFLGQAFASKGFITVIADYRLYPQVHFPQFVEDGASAFHWVHQHIASYHGNKNAVFLAGHSAGGFIAMMLTADTHYLKQAGANISWVKGTIGIAGPYDFLPFTDPKIAAVFSNTKDADTQPINYMNGIRPPIFLATGEDDTDVKPSNTIRLTTRLKQLNSPVETHFYPDTGHIGIILSLAHRFRHKSPLLDDIARFVEASLE